MKKEKELVMIATGRNFMKGISRYDEDQKNYQSDQDKKLPQPPLVKAAVSDVIIPLNKDFSPVSVDLNDIFYSRKSSRVYTKEDISLDELSYLLWATQGVKSIRGNNYATLRTVPCGGARHEYETYLLVDKVGGLKRGVYHYLPMEHALEFIKEVDDFALAADTSLCGQSWTAKANVIFFWAIDCYRVEWRYGAYAHRAALIDVGHIGENLYLACAALKLGVCGIASFEHEYCCELFDLDGVNEFVCYAAPVGTIKDEDKQKEADFYSFLKEE